MPLRSQALSSSPIKLQGGNASPGISPPGLLTLALTLNSEKLGVLLPIPLRGSKRLSDSHEEVKWAECS